MERESERKKVRHKESERERERKYQNSIIFTLIFYSAVDISPAVPSPFPTPPQQPPVGKSWSSLFAHQSQGAVKSSSGKPGSSTKLCRKEDEDVVDPQAHRLQGE